MNLSEEKKMFNKYLGAGSSVDLGFVVWVLDILDEFCAANDLVESDVDKDLIKFIYGDGM